MSITITDESSHVRFMDVKVDMKTFANILTGLAYQSCEFELRSPDIVGMVRENKIVPMPIPKYDANDDAIEAMFVPFEVDGWIGNRPDITNHHRHFNNKVNVGFHRFVSKED